jgi:hypothetical protein
MNTEKLQEQVMEYMKISINKIEDFAVNEIPPFIHEYITWKFYENLFPITLYVLFLLILTLVVYKFINPFWKWAFKSSKDNGDPIYFMGPGITTFLITVVVLFAFPYDNIKNCIQITVAPKVYLLEQVTNIIKSNVD